MKSIEKWTIALGAGAFGILAAFGTLVISGQNQTPAAPAPAAVPAAQQSGPGVQAPNDSKYAAYRAANCKNLPAPAAPRGGAGGGGGGGGARAAAAGPPMHRDYKVTEIPGVIAAGQTWKVVWSGTGNNADGPIATSDGGIMVAQNTDSKVMKLDKDNKPTFPYSDTNTGGALAMNKKGALFIVERGLPQEIWQLAPKRQLLANMMNGEPVDCAGGLLNDLTADSKGGVYFTKNGVHYADAKGVITKYGTVGGNGIILSPDEKTLYVTGVLGGGGRGGTAAPAAPAATPAAGPAGAPVRGAGGGGAGGGLVAFDVQPDGSLTNERQFAMVGGDGSTVDAAGRIYTTTSNRGGGDGNVHVLSPEGKELGVIPLPIDFISVAFSGPDKKTLYGIANDQHYDEIFTIQMIAQGYKERAK